MESKQNEESKKYWLNCAMQQDRDNEKQNKEHKFPSIMDM
jgi:hypothetical protein